MGTRLEIDISLSAPVVLDPRHNFDGVVAYLATRPLVSEGVTDPKRLDEVTAQLPLSKAAGAGGTFYLCSGADLSGACQSASITTMKMTSLQAYEKSVGKKDLEALWTRVIKYPGSGPYKARIITHTACVADSASYVLETDDEPALMNLLDDLLFLGKKRALGLGRVHDISVRQTEKMIRRNVPVDAGIEVEEPFFVSRLMPPYWQGEGRFICGMANL